MLIAVAVDYVITYVDGSDKEWVKEFNEYTESKIIPSESERFRSWDNLKYNLRCVYEYLPFIRNVYLVVSGESQVPDWVDRTNVKVIYHEDIIPKKFLPVFCSTTIEMFLGFIPGLSETFLYANDDTFVLKKCTAEDFFIEGKPVLNLAASNNTYNRTSQYELQLNNSLKLAKKASGKDTPYRKVMPKHSINALTVSSYKNVWASCKSDIEKQCTRFRGDDSYNQYLFSFYDWLNSNSIRNTALSSRYISFNFISEMDIATLLKRCTSKLICLNDSGVGNFEKYKNKINQTFEEMLPTPSKYEKEGDFRQDNPLRVHLYTLCYNEMKLLPLMVKYWKTVADEIFVLDNGSTDGSVEYLKNFKNIHVINFKSDGFNDDIHKKLKNSVWKASRGKADFVIVCDLDEVLYTKEGIRNTLEKMKRDKETICKPIGYNMYSDTFPEDTEKQIWEQCGNGVRDHLFDKVIVFNPSAVTEINYTPGAHKCNPFGKLRWRKENDVYLLHYKNLSLDYVLKRYDELSKRLSDLNRKRRWGVQYTRSKERTTNEFNFKLKGSVIIVQTEN